MRNPTVAQAPDADLEEDRMTDRIQRQATLPCDAARAWRAITDPEWLRSWLADAVTLELTPGGEATFLVDGVTLSGWVEEVSPPAPGGEPGSVGRLSFWWQRPAQPASRVALELLSTPTGTRLRVVETRPLEVLDLVGLPLPGLGGSSHGPVLVAA
jgi:uncharacterized protein YndB with AHSA1/START domain